MRTHPIPRANQYSCVGSPRVSYRTRRLGVGRPLTESVSIPTIAASVFRPDSSHDHSRPGSSGARSRSTRPADQKIVTFSPSLRSLARWESFVVGFSTTSVNVEASPDGSRRKIALEALVLVRFTNVHVRPALAGNQSAAGGGASCGGAVHPGPTDSSVEENRTLANVIAQDPATGYTATRLAGSSELRDQDVLERIPASRVPLSAFAVQPTLPRRRPRRRPERSARPKSRSSNARDSRPRP